MKNYNLIPQEKENYCVCSVLQAIFDKHGLEISQDEIAENLTPAEKGFYVDDSKIKKYLKKVGFAYEYYFHNQTPFNEPDMILKEEKDVFVGWNNHLLLVEGFKDPKINFINPLKGKKSPRELGTILRKMKNGKGFFGLITKL